MAEIVFGAATSHSPLLAAPPRLWAERADQDRTNPELYDDTGVIRSFDDLAAAAQGRFTERCAMPVWEDQWRRSQAALDRLRDDFRRALLMSFWSLVTTSANCSPKPTSRRWRSPQPRR